MQLIIHLVGGGVVLHNGCVSPQGYQQLIIIGAVYAHVVITITKITITKDQSLVNILLKIN